MRNLNLGCLIKIFILVAMVMAILYFLFTCTDSPGCMCQRIDNSLPDKTAAPYQVTTKTHLYYCKFAESNPDGSVVMSNWYERDDDAWVYHDGKEIIPALLRPGIYRR